MKKAQSARLEVLEVLKAAEGDDRIRQAAETIYQALIEAELAAAATTTRRSPLERRCSCPTARQ
jgi:hypothetical protein